MISTPTPARLWPGRVIVAKPVDPVPAVNEMSVGEV